MKINKYLVIIAVTLFFTSCEKDDAADVAAQTNNIQVIVEPFAPAGNTVIAQVGSNTVELDFGFRLNELTTTHYGSDVVVTFGGNDYTISPEFDNNGDLVPGTDEVVVGPTLISFNIAPTSTPYNGLETITEIDLSNIVYDISVTSRPSDLVVLKGSGTVDVNTTVYGLLPPATAGQINFLFDWSPNDTAGNDLDMRLRDSSGTSIDGSLTTNNYEGVSLLDSDPDDTYEVRAVGWTTLGGPIDGIIFAMHPDGTLEIFETDLTGIAPFGGFAEEIVMLNVDKVGSTYTLYQ